MDVPTDAQMEAIEEMVKSGTVQKQEQSKSSTSGTNSETSAQEQNAVTAEEIRRHSSPGDCWLVIDGQVWDFSEFASEHPGGEEIILSHAGLDASDAYNDIHAPSLVSKTLPKNCHKGSLSTSTPPDLLKPKPQETPQLQVSAKPPLSSIISAHDFEAVAEQTISKKAWAFYSSAATDCITRRGNREYFDRIWFRPRILRNVRGVGEGADGAGPRKGGRGMGSRIFGGIETSLPVFVSPAAMAKLVDKEGEISIARAAEKEGILQCISSNASFPAHEICASAPTHPFLFQLYVNKDRRATEKLLASLPPNIHAILLTVDAAIAGKREADERVRADESLSSPISGAKAINDNKGGAIGRIMASYIDPGLCWDDIAWLRRMTRLPIYLKGVMSVADAVLAADHGVDGILISNHGGRNLDTSPPALRTLLQLRLQRPDVFDRLEVYLDGGVRRGTDVLKALCLGARAVGLGRPVLYALNYGEEGVRHLVEVLRDEVRTAMMLVGITDLSECGVEYLDLGEVEGGLGVGLRARL